jgi:hypothetical protein
LGALEVQIQKYEADIRKHISIEHQLQLYADDLKRSVQVMDQEKETIEKNHSLQLDELKRDKAVLRDFLKIKDNTIQEL